MTTEQIIYEMLIENTGSHLLDSGGAYGRNWERNRKKTIEDFRREDEQRYDYKEWTDKNNNVNAYLERTVSVFHYLSQLETDDICERFNEINLESDNWDSDIYGVSSEAYNYLCRGDFDFELINEFNTYNSDSDLSQILQGAWVTIDGEYYLILQIHNGCDARGGYTTARLFKTNEEGIIHEYLQEFIYDIEEELEYIDNVYVDGELKEFTNNTALNLNYLRQR